MLHGLNYFIMVTMYQESMFFDLTCVTGDDFVSVRASKSHKVQQLSTSEVQQVQYQSLKNKKFQQSSTRFWIWFGTSGSATWVSRAESEPVWKLAKKRKKGLE